MWGAATAAAIVAAAGIQRLCACAELPPTASGKACSFIEHTVPKGPPQSLSAWTGEAERHRRQRHLTQYLACSALLIGCLHAWSDVESAAAPMPQQGLTHAWGAAQYYQHQHGAPHPGGPPPYPGGPPPQYGAPQYGAPPPGQAYSAAPGWGPPPQQQAQAPPPAEQAPPAHTSHNPLAGFFGRR